MHSLVWYHSEQWRPCTLGWDSPERESGPRTRDPGVLARSWCARDGILDSGPHIASF